MRLAATCFLLAASVPSAAIGQGAPADSAAAVDQIFRWATKESPGCAVGVARAGRPLLTRGYGMANLEYDVPITESTVFEAGSVS